MQWGETHKTGKVHLGTYWKHQLLLFSDSYTITVAIISVLSVTGLGVNTCVLYVLSKGYWNYNVDLFVSRIQFEGTTMYGETIITNVCRQWQTCTYTIT